MQRLAHDTGEIAMAKAAVQHSTVFGLSSASTTSIEDLASAVPDAIRWFQLYVLADRELTRALVQRAERAGYTALVLTVDLPVQGQREPDMRNGFTLPSHLTLANFTASGNPEHTAILKGGGGLSAYVKALYDRSLSWPTVKWLQSITKLPIILKGILTAEDAEQAVRSGVQGVIVSNHGGRQLDTVPATLEVLPEVVTAIGGRIPVLFDGGIRRGTDAFKALALGASAVLVGRPVLWGLAVDGERGVAHVLKLLNDELLQTMQLAGCSRVSEITARHVATVDSYYQNIALRSRL